MPPATRPPRVARIMFESSVKLLEAAARNDVDEGKQLVSPRVGADTDQYYSSRLKIQMLVSDSSQSGNYAVSNCQ